MGARRSVDSYGMTVFLVLLTVLTLWRREAFLLGVWLILMAYTGLRFMYVSLGRPDSTVPDRARAVWASVLGSTGEMRWGIGFVVCCLLLALHSRLSAKPGGAFIFVLLALGAGIRLLAMKLPARKRTAMQIAGYGVLCLVLVLSVLALSR